MGKQEVLGVETIEFEELEPRLLLSADGLGGPNNLL